MEIKTGRIYDFMSIRKYWIAFSIIASLISLVLLWKPGPRFGIDFLGGTELTVQFSGPVTTDAVRHALEQMGNYQRTHEPQPVNPVMQAAVVRLMWVPDHMNKSVDLVPAHYYYLKVKKEDWAAQDAFELEAQLNGPGGSTSSFPFVIDNAR